MVTSAGRVDGTTTAGGSGPSPLVRAIGLRKVFRSRTRGFGRGASVAATAVDGVSFDVGPGETLGLVGESGSGKSTTARLLLRLLDPTDGRIEFDGQDVTELRGRPLRALRRDMQAVFQDVTGSLNPRMTVEQLLAEPLRFHRGLDRAARRRRTGELLDLVGLAHHHRSRYPGELSGGQRQRVGLARGLAVEPKLLVLDEPVSALDVSTQSQAVNLLGDLQHELGVAYLFVAHDLFVVHHISHRVAVMYLGAIAELGSAAQVYERPRHPYTQALLSAIPHPDPRVEQRRERIVLGGDVPSPAAIPSGCRFHTRCPYAMDVCREVAPPSLTFPDGGEVACHLHTDGPRLDGRSVNQVAFLRPTTSV